MKMESDGKWEGLPNSPVPLPFLCSAAVDNVNKPFLHGSYCLFFIIQLAGFLVYSIIGIPLSALLPLAYFFSIFFRVRTLDGMDPLYRLGFLKLDVQLSICVMIWFL